MRRSSFSVDLVLLFYAAVERAAKMLCRQRPIVRRVEHRSIMSEATAGAALAGAGAAIGRDCNPA
jgi:hypothetical protein